jgi:hypothetical protein
LIQKGIDHAPDSSTVCVNKDKLAASCLTTLPDALSFNDVSAASIHAPLSFASANAASS